MENNKQEEKEAGATSMVDTSNENDTPQSTITTTTTTKKTDAGNLLVDQTTLSPGAFAVSGILNESVLVEPCDLGPGDDEESPNPASPALKATARDTTSDGGIIEAELATDVQEIIRERDTFRSALEAVPSASLVTDKDLQDIHGRRNPRWLWPVIGVAVVLAVTLVVLLAVLLPSDGESDDSDDSLVCTRSEVLGPTDDQFDTYKDIFEKFYGTGVFDDVDGDRYRALYWLAMEDTNPLDPQVDDFELVNQRYVLALSYFAGCGQHWQDHDNWLLGMNVCRWDHVNCHDDPLEYYVQELDLSAIQFFSGTLPSEIGTLANLTRFACTTNDLLIGTLPTNYGQLTKLTDLSIGGTSLHGTLPTELGLLTDLVFFASTEANFSGPVPTELGLLTKLEELFIGKNDYDGQLPTELTKLTLLERFHLHDNLFTGSLNSIVCNSTSSSLLRDVLKDVGSDCLTEVNATAALGVAMLLLVAISREYAA
eukprot:CAMPEP_0113447108 /NCGR_PEP_ID=MMETSP0014_2-20120614/4066_1 /TAXON_ID=2857 /ORGANISM="Nitzschia sp." /LENGTH=482 /DNA_ID=CAMNT_0000338249 /DNA_START=89 /DNA_END=1538 /DNA_ORIENTATION=- /assembly_acc=CAM_ASM_000159